VSDFIISMAVSVIIQLARDPKGRGKWRKALLKVFREIASAFRDDNEFQMVVESGGKPS